MGDHAQRKDKVIRGNHALFMTKELSKVVTNKSKTENKYFNWPSREKIKYRSMNREAKTKKFKETTKVSEISNKNFWKIVKPLLTKKRCLQNHFEVQKSMRNQYRGVFRTLSNI